VASVKAVKTNLRKYTLTFAGAEEAHPWGENVTKVRGKVFAFFGPEDDTSDGLMGVKLTRSLLYARSLPYVEPMGYGLGKSGWCTVKKPARGSVDLKLMKEWIAESYEAIAASRKASAGGRASRRAAAGTRARSTSASSGRRAGSSRT
jgi:predicted DNA-binding protein (MmcQ/YjbR family)